MALKNLFDMVKADRYTSDGREALIKAQEAETEDKVYQIGEISQKTGLQKTANGWVKPKNGKQPAAKKEEPKNVYGAEVDKIYERQLKRIKELKAKGFTDEQIDNDKIIKQTKEDMKNVGKQPAENKPDTAKEIAEHREAAQYYKRKARSFSETDPSYSTYMKKAEEYENKAKALEGSKPAAANKTTIRQGPKTKTLNETPAEHVQKNLDAYKGYSPYDMEELVLKPSGYEKQTSARVPGGGQSITYTKNGAEDITLFFDKNGELENADVAESKSAAQEEIGKFYTKFEDVQSAYDAGRQTYPEGGYTIFETPQGYKVVDDPKISQRMEAAGYRKEAEVPEGTKPPKGPGENIGINEKENKIRQVLNTALTPSGDKVQMTKSKVTGDFHVLLNGKSTGGGFRDPQKAKEEFNAWIAGKKAPSESAKERINKRFDESEARSQKAMEAEGRNFRSELEANPKGAYDFEKTIEHSIPMTAGDKEILGRVKSFMQEEGTDYKNALKAVATGLVNGNRLRGNWYPEKEQSLLKIAKAVGMDDEVKSYVKTLAKGYDFGYSEDAAPRVLTGDCRIRIRKEKPALSGDTKIRVRK